MAQEFNLATLLKKVFTLLKQIEPDKDNCDILWHGPYFIPRATQWHSSSFVLYAGTLYCRLLIEGCSYGLSWKIGTEELKFEVMWGASGPFINNEYLWKEALSQIYKRLKRAVKNPESYNRWVVRFLPFEYRSGKIERHYTWEKGVKSVLPMRKIKRLEKILEETQKLPLLQKMTLSMYLKVVAVAYDAVFKKLRSFSPREKYEKKADGRHGGLLDLPQNDPIRFEKWYHSDRWAGSHPWEIVFGHPHGIMIAPHYDREKRGWNYSLWVDSLGWYSTAALMALALGGKGISFEFRGGEDVLNALKGIDNVEVGPFIGLEIVHYGELKSVRPDALPHIHWDAIPQIVLISAEQKKRVEIAETGKKGLSESA